MVAFLSDLEVAFTASLPVCKTYWDVSPQQDLQLITPILFLPLLPIPPLSTFITPLEKFQLFNLSNRRLINQPFLIVRHRDRSRGRSVNHIPRV
jgi:hypothetical protein